MKFIFEAAHLLNSRLLDGLLSILFPSYFSKQKMRLQKVPVPQSTAPDKKG